jgi:hypothetical protein
MKKEYKVFVSQLVFYEKTILAESAEQAEKISFDDSDYGSGWKDYAYGDWRIEEVREVTQ